MTFMLIWVPPRSKCVRIRLHDVVARLLVAAKRRVELDLHGRRVAVAGLHRGDGHGHARGRAILAEARVGVGAVRDGLAGVPAVGRGASALPMAMVLAQEKRPGIML